MRKILLFITSLLMLTAAFAQQRAMGDNTSAEDYAKVLRSADRATRDLADLPSSYSLKKYAPAPGNQGQYGTCVAWSSAYAARTISYAIQRKETNIDNIKQNVFSPGYLYYKIKKSGDDNCENGANITNAMKVMSNTGIMLKKEGPVDCTVSIPVNLEQEKALPYKIKDYLSLNETYGSVTKNDILKMKKSLSENKPVVISFKVYSSFSNIPSSGLWTPTSDDNFRGGHAMCVVGYDDKKAGGAFEVMNSWGPNWANGGFFWLTYDQMISYGNYAVEMMDFEIVKPEVKPEISGDIEFISLEGATMPVVRKKVNTRSIIVEDDDKADYSLYKFTTVYPGGTAFKMKFGTNAPSYIYVFAEDDKAVVSRLFPYNRTVSAAVNSANATYFFPSETKHARLSNTPGKENICVLYSKSEIDFEGLMDYINTSKVPIYQAVKDKLAARLLDLKKVKFVDDKISFKAPSEDRSVLCFFIELEHN